MSEFTIGGTAATQPTAFRAPIVERHGPAWSAPWQVDAEIEVERLQLYASSSQVSTLTFRRRYGHVKFPTEANYRNVGPLDLRGHWIRVSLVDDAGVTTVLFVGQVDDQARTIQGQDNAPSGRQTWVASNPLCSLRKLHVKSAMFLEGSVLTTVGWLPPMNVRDHRGLLTGNRSDAPMLAGSTYGYGGSNLWTHREYVEYLMMNFIRQDGGPSWTLGGQESLLNAFTTSIQFGACPTAAEILSALIPPRYGVDWYCAPVPGGFEIRVFALGTADVEVATESGTVRMPKNADTVRVLKGRMPELIDCQVVQSQERRCDKIEVVGKRIVVCGTLGESLVPKWTSADEALYLAPDGGTTTDPQKLDEMRKEEAFLKVWQAFGVPDNWDHAGGKWCVACKDDGTFISGADANGPQYQTTIRETLSWLPLKVGYDYSLAGAIIDPDRNLDGKSELRYLAAWVGLVTDRTGLHPGGRRYLCHEMGMSVHNPHFDWGVRVDAHPAHALALNIWTDANWLTTAYLGDRFAYGDLKVTLSIHSDHRIRLAYELPDGQKAGDGSVWTVEDAESEAWVVLPSTTVGLATDGTYLTTSAEGYLVMRDDRPRLAMVLAGLVSRYLNDRVRASLTWRGWAPWGDLLGRIMSVVEQGDDLSTVGAPITSLEWILTPQPMTILKTGYA